MARGKYWKALGNTPGHVNHWNIFSFDKLIKCENLLILSKKYPLPWQMMLLKVADE